MRPGRRLLVVDKPERTQTQILVGTLGTSPHDDDHVPLVVGERRLRRDLHLAPDEGDPLQARLVVRRERAHGHRPAAAVVGPVDLPRRRGRRALPRAVARAPRGLGRATGVTPREVAFIQRYLVRSHAFEIDTATKRLHQALDVELSRLPRGLLLGWIERVRAVTPESASAAVKKPHPPRRSARRGRRHRRQVLDPLRSAIPRPGEVERRALRRRVARLARTRGSPRFARASANLVS